MLPNCEVLTQVARGEQINNRSYFTRLRSLLTEPDDLFSYTKRSSAIYRGILNLFNYASQGLNDWNSTQKIDTSMRLEDHHIYPRAYIASKPELDIDQSAAEQLVDCVVNRTLIPKLLNIQIGKKAPGIYLAELQQSQNSKLAECLPSHLIPADMITNHDWNSCFGVFLGERAKVIFGLIERYTSEPASEMMNLLSAQGDGNEKLLANGKPKLKDLLAAGKVVVGDRVFTQKQPSQVAQIVDGETVEFNGKHIAINAWGQQVTGWSSINIYESVILERTGKPLKTLRGE